MPKFTLDTNVFIDAIRDPAAAERTDMFLSRALPHTFLSSVVMHELFLGARSGAEERAIERAFEAPFAARGRLLAPSPRAWRRAATVLRAMHGAGVARLHRSDGAEALLACQARELGLTLVSGDADFSRIAKHLPGLKWARPFPTR